MATVHPTAILEGDVRLGDDVAIGPHCVIRGDVAIGAGTRLIGSVWIEGPLTLGRENLLYPGTSLGFSPQSVAWDPATPGEGTVIGDRNVFREHVTVHRAMTDEGPTRIGDDCFLMAQSHAGHDAQVGSHVVLANSAALGGHTVVGDRVFFGGSTALHQFCRVGEGAMISGLSGASMDVPANFVCTGINVCSGVNVVGMRRRGLDRADIDTVRWVQRVACRDGLSRASLLARLAERAGDPVVDGYRAFFESCTRGWITARPRPARGSGA